MLRLSQLKLPVDHSAGDLLRYAARALHVPPGAIDNCTIRRRAIDARKKTSVHLVYTLDIELKPDVKAPAVAAKYKLKTTPDESYVQAIPGKERCSSRPVIVGSGPAGLFAGLILARAGYKPLIIERGKQVRERCRDLERFWKEGVLDPESNAQFGEGGAGTFSDGKLNTATHDRRIRKVLEELVEAGADKEILFLAKPHIGTDRLRTIVSRLRETITTLGGEVRFGNKLTGLKISGNSLQSILINSTDSIPCSALVVAIGHSARDTFDMLYKSGIPIEPKPFAMGVRIEHSQRLIDETQYGKWAGHPALGAADYKMAWHGPDGRSVFTFCMCPGGSVIGASSEPGGVVTNGMSFYTRDSGNANAALLVTVTPEDYNGDSPLSGFAFQRELEQKAFELGGKNYCAPAQLLRDFRLNRGSKSLGSVEPTYRPGVVPSDMNRCLPRFMCIALQSAIPVFAGQLRGFDCGDAVLTGVETRSSCPVRIIRGDDYQSKVHGIYSAGEGAGYAGGIVSSAVDGIKVAEAIIERFAVH
jgi:uncharacterized protein